MHLRILLAGLLLTGCATPLERVISVAGDVPDWFVERSEEIKGEGYPELAEVPNSGGSPITDEQTNAVASVLVASQDFFNHPRAQESALTKADIIALKEELFAEFEAIDRFAKPKIMSEAEIAAIKALFVPYESQAIDPEG
ncbi:MAG: hypothetical protein AAFX02_05540 [Pseudomonadota bacterium]